MVFCRECRPGYTRFGVLRFRIGVLRFRIVASYRDLPRETSPTELLKKTLMPGTFTSGRKNPWPDEGSEEFVRRLPDDWIDEAGRVVRSRREHRPQPIHVQPNGEQAGGAGGAGGDGTPAWFIPAPFRFCLHCGVSYGFRRRSDFQKLSALGSEGRSTATTILALSAIRHLKEFPVHETAKKLLSFTDNRQDASLQAGHFNDFIEVGLLRSALYQAAQASGSGGLTHDQLTLKVFGTLALPFEHFALDATLRGLAREETNRVLRDVLGYRLYRDLKRGWRIMAPNLEQVGLLKIEYPYLDDACQ